MWVLYSYYRFQWNTRTVGLTLAAVGVFSALVQGGLVRPAVARLGERRALMFGLACGAAGFAAYGLAPTGRLFLIGIPFGALWGFAGPSAQALLTGRVDSHEQGRLQGALAGMRGISGMLGPGIFTGVFAFFIGKNTPWHLPGAPFLLAAALLGAALLLASLVARPKI
jgi:DHA1 family tetracycline resistance protein-like MFS transporter